jgi:hypothetical protein
MSIFNNYFDMNSRYVDGIDTSVRYVDGRTFGEWHGRIQRILSSECHDSDQVIVAKGPAAAHGRALFLMRRPRLLSLRKIRKVMHDFRRYFESGVRPHYRENEELVLAGFASFQFFLLDTLSRHQPSWLLACRVHF